MANVTVYLKCDRNVEVQSQDACLSDLGQLRCRDSHMAEKLKALKVHHFEEDGSRRCVISSLHLVELMENAYSNISVEIVGETDVLLEWVYVKKHKGWQQWLKTFMVCLIKMVLNIYFLNTSNMK